MKNALLAVSTEKEEVNIGDYIQQLAAMQFLGQAGTFVERENIDAYDGEKVRMILNGWFMHHPQHWPPSPQIVPLFVSFHMTPSAVRLMTERGADYFKQHEPIGCRDQATLHALQAAGIKAWFSGCLTLTLGLHYRNAAKEKKIYIVDPVLTGGRDTFDATRLRDFATLLRHPRLIKSLAARMGHTRPTLHTMLRTATFFNEYRAYFDESILCSAEYLTHRYPSPDEENGYGNAYYFEEAGRLIRQYARAQLVITSRIHCALPCLGVGTPVVYVEHADNDEAGRCRMGGIRELFHTLSWERGRIRGSHLPGNGRIGLGNVPHNKTGWKPLAAKLAEACYRFCATGNSPEDSQ